MHQLQLSLGCCVKWTALICNNMQEEKEVKPPNTIMKHREERQTQALNNNYYRTRTGRTLRRGGFKYKPYWKVESGWTHLDWHCMSSKPKSEMIRKSHTQRIHNAFNENSNTFIQGLTYGVSLTLHYSCGYKEITAVFEEKKERDPVLQLMHAQFTHRQQTQMWDGAFHQWPSLHWDPSLAVWVEKKEEGWERSGWYALKRTEQESEKSEGWVGNTFS